MAVFTEPEKGSPPHTRGIRMVKLLFPDADRFTPAYAGNTCEFGLEYAKAWVHPRIRGEYSAAIPSQTPSQGSPPHTRGILHIAATGHRPVGFTPAYAGNTNHSELGYC